MGLMQHPKWLNFHIVTLGFQMDASLLSQLLHLTSSSQLVARERSGGGPKPCEPAPMWETLESLLASDGLSSGFVSISPLCVSAFLIQINKYIVFPRTSLPTAVLHQLCNTSF